MQPWFEAVTIPERQSCLVYDRRLPEFGFNWHYHRECELTLTLAAGARGSWAATWPPMPRAIWR